MIDLSENGANIFFIFRILFTIFSANIILNSFITSSKNTDISITMNYCRKLEISELLE